MEEKHVVIDRIEDCVVEVEADLVSFYPEDPEGLYLL